MTPAERDLIIRTVYGEANGQPVEGQAAVAHVIRNRVAAGGYGGNDVRSVVLARNQFEPWGTAAGRSRMQALDPNGEDYQKIGAIVDNAFNGGQDPTQGATHFVAPVAQTALGRRMPNWATDDVFMGEIGGHAFYAPNGPAAQAAIARGGSPVSSGRAALPAGATLIDDGPQPVALTQPPQGAAAAPAAQAATAAAAGQAAPQTRGQLPAGAVLLDEPQAQPQAQPAPVQQPASVETVTLDGQQYRPTQNGTWEQMGVGLVRDPVLSARLDQAGAAQSATPPATVGGAQPTPAAPAQDQPARERMGPVEAGARGAANGFTLGFGDEIQGIHRAGGGSEGGLGQNVIDYGPVLGSVMNAGRLVLGGARMALGNEEANRTYQETVDRERQALQRARADQPIASIGGEIVGAVANPIGAVRGAQMASRPLAELARSGLVQGALAGVGNAEGGPLSRVTGGVTGGVTGAILSPGLEVGRRAVSGLAGIATAPLQPYFNAVRGWINPEQEAARRIAGALSRDARTAGTAAPADMADQAARMEFTPMGRQTGAPIITADMGGEATRALARSAANTSDEAREVLSAATRDRYAGQSNRVIDFLRTFIPGAARQEGPQTPADFIRSITPNIDNPAMREAVQAAAAARTSPLYRQAYQEGDRSIISPNLERLLTAPAVVDAVREAAQRGQNRAVAEGMGGFRSAVSVTEDGRVLFNRGPSGVPTYPNLQFWDYVQRNLRDAGDVARRAGRNEEAGAIDALRRQLNGELDSLVPQFGQARAAARAGFAADDAIEAGRQFARAPNMENRQAARALQQMSPQERQAFGQAYMAEIGRRMDEAADPAAFIRSLRTPGAQERLRLVAGPQVAEQFQQQLARQDAIQLGRQLVTDEVTPQTRRAIAQMTPENRAEFQRSFGAELIRGVENTPDRANTINRIYNSPAARSRVEAVFGREGASEFEAFLRVEGIMQRVNEATNGNSSTARQLLAAGLAGGAAGGYSSDWSWQGMLSGAGAGAGARRYLIPAVDQRVAQQVGQLLASNDPAQIQRLTQMAARSPAVMNVIRSLEGAIGGRQAGENAGALSQRLIGAQGPVPVRAQDNQDQNRQP